MEGGREAEYTNSVSPVSFPDASIALAEGGCQEGSAKGQRVITPLPLSHPTSVQAGWPGGRSPYERGSKGPPGTLPEAGACLPRLPKAGSPALHQGTQPEAAGSEASAAERRISHKGGSQWALLGEIRETGNAEPSFNTHLIFMEQQQRQPPCRERSRSTEGEQRSPTNSF